MQLITMIAHCLIQHKESWLSIPDFEGFYSVSNLGKIRRDISANNTFSGRILKQSKIRGYFRVDLFKNGIGKTIKVHRLVALAFLGKCHEGIQVNHIDGNKENNCSKNLEYVTPYMNTMHAVKLGLKPRGERHFKSKLTYEKVLSIRAEYATGTVLQKDLAKKYGVNQTNISFITRGATWINYAHN